MKTSGKQGRSVVVSCGYIAAVLMLFCMLFVSGISGRSSASANGAGLAAGSPEPVVVFDMCIVDDSNHNQISFNSTTGNYSFTNCTGFTMSGTGKVKRKNLCIVALEDTKADRRLSAQIDLCLKKGKASLETFSPGAVRTITDRNTANDQCGCGTA